MTGPANPTDPEPLLRSMRQVEESLVFRALFNQTNDAVFVLDTEGRHVITNQRAAEMLGYTCEEIVGKSLREIVATSELTKSLATRELLLAGQKIPPYERLFLKKDGTELPVEINAHLIADDQGQPLYILSIVRDISERKRLETQLQERELYFRKLIEYSLDVIILLDAEGNVCYQNPDANRILGYGNGELVGQPIIELIHPEDVDFTLAKLRELITTPGAFIQGEARVRHQRGDYRWVEYYGRNLLAEPGVKALVINSHDITDRKLTEARALELAAERKRIEALRQFITNVSHDLRTPLSVITTNSYLIRRTTRDLETQQSRLDLIDAQTARLKKVLDEMLTMARLDTEIAAYTYSPTQVNELIQEIVAENQALVSQEHQQIIATLDPRLPVILMDHFELRRAISHLVANAVQYTPTGGQIQLHTQTDGHYLMVEVQDTGIGIAEQDLPRIFDRFYRADTARGLQTGGTGLGLAIVKKFADDHNGMIEVESEPGKGSTFRLKLPLLH